MQNDCDSARGGALDNEASRPRPEPLVEDLQAGAAAAAPGRSFRLLLEQLGEEHDRKVAELQRQIRALRKERQSPEAAAMLEPSISGQGPLLNTPMTDGLGGDARTPSARSSGVRRTPRTPSDLVHGLMGAPFGVLPKEDSPKTTASPQTPTFRWKSSSKAADGLMFLQGYAETKKEDSGHALISTKTSSLAVGGMGFAQKLARKVTDHYAFDVCCAGAIMINAIVLGLSADSTSDTELPHGILIMNYIFSFVFLFELLLKFLSLGVRRYFCGSRDTAWNWFDFIVVVSDIIAGVLSFLDVTSGRGPTVLRVVRVLRVSRALRIVRVIHIFRELRMMFTSILHCLWSLLWSLILFFLIIYIFGIYFLQQAALLIEDPGTLQESDIVLLQYRWGTLPRVWYTLFACMTGGRNWADIAEPFVDGSPSSALMMCFFIFFTTIVVANVITGIFVDSAIQRAQSDREEVIQEQMRSDDSAVKQFTEILTEADIDGSGWLSHDELEQHLQNTDVKLLLKALELRVDEARGLFNLLDRTCVGQIEISEFVLGCVRLKGNAKSIDLATLMYENKLLVKQFGILKDIVVEGFTGLDGFKGFANLDWVVNPHSPLHSGRTPASTKTPKAEGAHSVPLWEVRQPREMAEARVVKPAGTLS